MATVNASAKPAFVGDRLRELGHAFVYAEEPPGELIEGQFLEHENPWLRVLSVIEQAKRGRFDHVARLPEWLRRCSDNELLLVGLEFLGYAATPPLHRELVYFFNHPDHDARLAAYRAARDCMHLDLVEPLLAARRRHTGFEREAIGDRLSVLLEGEAGAVAEPLTTDHNAYEALVRERRDQLLATTGKLYPIYAGRIFSLLDLVDKIERLARDPDVETTGGVAPSMIDLFAAMTGMPCVDLFDEDIMPRPISILATIERFRGSTLFAASEPGYRYFYGHKLEA